jgi:hypothetical protein
MLEQIGAHVGAAFRIFDPYKQFQIHAIIPEAGQHGRGRGILQHAVVLQRDAFETRDNLLRIVVIAGLHR